jgi:pimeloyl-ACP methyl ester carboxylesterase
MSQAAVIGRTLRRRASGVSVAALATSLAGLVVATATTTASADEATRASRPVVRVSPVCFTVSAPGHTRAELFGLRYSAGHPVASTPAIVLVHGVESSTSDWDFTPKWSVARWLADAGYLVISYDRLGYSRSPYRGPGGGNALTLVNAQLELHEVITAIHAGSYRLAATEGCTADRRAPRARLRSRHVILVGHSLGGFLVAGYPGRFHDVSALVQADSEAGLSSELAVTPTPTSSQPAPTIVAQGYEYLFTTRAACARFDFFEPGVVPSVAEVACDPSALPASPAGEENGLAALDVLNNRYIPTTGVPVLLTWGAEDPLFPPAAATLDDKAWRADCRCSVTELELPNTGHLFMAHKSLPLWTRTLTSWLRSHGLAGNSNAHPANVLPP